MTDRELIEAAAKAGGMPPWTWDEESGCINCQHRSDLTNMHFWNPLTDDGDALRLAVKLGILVLTARGFAVANSRDSGGTVERLLSDPDPHAATRRAIVCAAASIGGPHDNASRQAATPAPAEPDAARYRWLCANKRMPWGMVPGLKPATLIEDGIDAAIDEALLAAPPATPAPAEPVSVHPQSLRGLVESCGGNYLTGGGAAFTSAALAKFVEATAEAAVDDYALTAAPPATPAAQPAETWPPALPPFIRRDVERAIHEAENPKGMSVHDGKARIGADRLRYLLRVIDSAAPSAPNTAQEAE